MFKVRHLSDENFGELTILINDLTGCWFLVKEILSTLKLKYTAKKVESIVNPSNMIKLRYLTTRNDKTIYEQLWKSKNDHNDKVLINKFGVLQLIHSITSYNTNSIVEQFIGMTFRKTILSNLPQQQTTNVLSELDKQRLKLFSDNKFEVVEAHKAILKLEIAKERNNIAQKQNDKQAQQVVSKVDQEKMYNAIVSELNIKIEEINRLRNLIGRGNEWSTVAFKKREWKKRFGHNPDWKELVRLSKEIGILPVKDVIEKDKKGIERKVNRYHNDVWKKYEEQEMLNLQQRRFVKGV